MENKGRMRERENNIKSSGIEEDVTGYKIKSKNIKGTINETERTIKNWFGLPIGQTGFTRPQGLCLLKY